MGAFDPLKKNAEFRVVYGRGRAARRNMLVMYALENNTEKTRLGISAGKKVGGAVKRNLIKRLIRENYRRAAPRVKKGYDVVVVALAEAGALERGGAFSRIGSSLEHLLARHGLLK
jgi:ribonuclease P protein component